MLAEISRAKNRLEAAAEYEHAVGHPASPAIGVEWRGCESELRCCNAFDFDDLLAPATRSRRVVLRRNLRSRAEILEAAARCGSHNERRRRTR